MQHRGDFTYVYDNEATKMQILNSKQEIHKTGDKVVYFLYLDTESTLGMAQDQIMWCLR